jgi:plasmid rolling circle replication initiator protein Rep
MQCGRAYHAQVAKKHETLSMLTKKRAWRMYGATAILQESLTAKTVMAGQIDSLGP